MSESRASGQSREEGDLRTKVGAWLATEGYPLEFATAAAFREVGFSVLQAEYTEPTPLQPRREVDVVAQMSARGDTVVRVEFVVECKWSADKPWVFFCGDRGMTTAASATQSIGSQLGELLLWKEAGNPALNEIGIFRTARRCAFGGRQAFSKSTDVVFDALRAVIANGRALADEYDHDLDRAVACGRLPKFAVVTFPVIVVESRMFEASASKDGLDLEEVSLTRVRFRGAHDHRFIATVDVVRADQLEPFVCQRAADAKALLEIMSTALMELSARNADGDLDRLSVTSGSRGVVGVPPLLPALMRARASMEAGQARPPGEDSAATSGTEAQVKPPE